MVSNARGTISELGALFSSLPPATEIRDASRAQRAFGAQDQKLHLLLYQKPAQFGTSSIGVRQLPVANCDGTMSQTSFCLILAYCCIKSASCVPSHLMERDGTSYQTKQ